MSDDQDHDDLNDDVDANTETDAEIEARARRHGWVPEEEWDDERAEREGRHKPNFVSAAEYLERIEAKTPIMRQQLREQDRTIVELRQELKDTAAETQRKLDEMAELFRYQQKQGRAARERAFRQGIEEAEKRKREAVSEADTDKFDAAQADINRIYEEAREEESQGGDPPPDPKKTEEPQKPELDPVTQKWVDENPWFVKDRVLQAAMIENHIAVKQESPGMTEWESLEEAAKRTREDLPKKFGVNPRRNAPGTVSTPSGQRGSGKDSVMAKFKALPAEDRAAYENHKKMFKEQHGEDFTIEQFLEDYHS